MSSSVFSLSSLPEVTPAHVEQKQTFSQVIISAQQTLKLGEPAQTATQLITAATRVASMRYYFHNASTGKMYRVRVEPIPDTRIYADEYQQQWGMAAYEARLREYNLSKIKK